MAYCVYILVSCITVSNKPIFHIRRCPVGPDNVVSIIQFEILREIRKRGYERCVWEEGAFALYLKIHTNVKVISSQS